MRNSAITTERRFPERWRNDDDCATELPTIIGAAMKGGKMTKWNLSYFKHEWTSSPLPPPSSPGPVKRGFKWKSSSSYEAGSEVTEENSFLFSSLSLSGSQLEPQVTSYSTITAWLVDVRLHKLIHAWTGLGRTYSSKGFLLKLETGVTLSGYVTLLDFPTKFLEYFYFF